MKWEPLPDDATAQEVFDAVWHRMTEQGRPSVNAFGDCVYRGPDDTACAVGCVVSDEMAQRMDDHWCPDIDALVAEEIAPTLAHWHVNLMADLQLAHDTAGGDDFTASFQDRARKVAERHSLTVPA